MKSIEELQAEADVRKARAFETARAVLEVPTGEMTVEQFARARETFAAELAQYEAAKEELFWAMADAHAKRRAERQRAKR